MLAIIQNAAIESYRTPDPDHTERRLLVIRFAAYRRARAGGDGRQMSVGVVMRMGADQGASTSSGQATLSVARRMSSQVSAMRGDDWRRLAWFGLAS